MPRDAAEKLILGILGAILAAIVIPIVAGAVTPKVSRADFIAHIQETESKIDSVSRDVRRIDSRQERILDVLCSDNARHRSCASVGTAR